jgi:hypothetical protein
MKVRELIELLQEQNPELEVLYHTWVVDQDGQGYVNMPLSGVEPWRTVDSFIVPERYVEVGGGLYRKVPAHEEGRERRGVYIVGRRGPS